MAGSRVEDHVAAFNATVASGRWEGFAGRFATDAEMEFVGAAVGPFTGRAAIAAAYAADPPREALALTGPVTRERGDAVATFRWANGGGTGTMRIRFGATGLVERLRVSFDQ